MAAKYIPPALRAKMAAEAAASAAEQAPASLTDWLREARKGYVAKTPEQIRQECLSMNYEQLRKRAGPPPPVTSDDYGGVWEQGGEGAGAAVCVTFDEDLRGYKLGRCPPPPPLGFDGRDEGDVDAALAMEGAVTQATTKSASAQRRAAYNSWYSIYGSRLTWLWAAEHPTTTTKKLPPVRREVEKPKAPTRGALAAAAAEAVSEKSGW